MKRSCRPKVRGCVWNSVKHPHGGGNHQHCETVDNILASVSPRLEGREETQCKTSSLIPESGTTADVEMVSCVSETRSRSLTSLPEETTQTSVQERPEGRTGTTCRGPVQRAVSAPWKESSRSHAADSAVDDDVDVLSGSTRS